MTSNSPPPGLPDIEAELEAELKALPLAELWSQERALRAFLGALPGRWEPGERRLRMTVSVLRRRGR